MSIFIGSQFLFSKIKTDIDQDWVAWETPVESLSVATRLCNMAKVNLLLLYIDTRLPTS